MRKESVLNEEDFNNLLNWLSPDREEAGVKYEEIRNGLVRFFRFHRCGDPLAMADETINRVARKVSAFTNAQEIKTISFFYGFARKILLEHASEAKRREIYLESAQPLIDKYNFVGEDAPELNCLEECLATLPEELREIVIKYYSENKSAKFKLRKEMAENMNLQMGALHAKVFRIRKELKKCVENCLKKKL